MFLSNEKAVRHELEKEADIIGLAEGQSKGKKDQAGNEQFAKQHKN